MKPTNLYKLKLDLIATKNEKSRLAIHNLLKIIEVQNHQIKSLRKILQQNNAVGIPTNITNNRSKL